MKPSSFQLFAETKGIKLLKDDINFIKRCLNLIPYQDRRKTLEKYAMEWLKGMNSSDIVYRRQNLGRRKANEYLRELVDAGSGKVV